MLFAPQYLLFFRIFAHNFNIISDAISVVV